MKGLQRLCLGLIVIFYFSTSMLIAQNSQRIYGEDSVALAGYDNLSCRGYIENDEKMGEWICLDEQGNVILQGNYFRNFKIGRWIEYHSNGHVKRQCNYLSDTLFIYNLIQERKKEPAPNIIPPIDPDSIIWIDELNDPTTKLINQQLKEGNFQATLITEGIDGEWWIRDGQWKLFDPSGNLLQIETYEKGNRISWIRY